MHSDIQGQFALLVGQCLHTRCIRGRLALPVAMLTCAVHTRCACIVCRCAYIHSVYARLARVVSGCASVRDAYEVGLRGLSVLTWDSANELGLPLAVSSVFDFSSASVI